MKNWSTTKKILVLAAIVIAILVIANWDKVMGWINPASSTRVELMDANGNPTGTYTKGPGANAKALCCSVGQFFLGCKGRFPIKSTDTIPACGGTI